MRFKDANGDPVPNADVQGDEAFIAWLTGWFADRVPAPDCPHYMAVSEARAGFQRCERCT